MKNRFPKKKYIFSDVSPNTFDHEPLPFAYVAFTVDVTLGYVIKQTTGLHTCTE